MRTHKARAQLVLAELIRADELLVWMVSVTVVLPVPAGTGLGENVAVAPLGCPLAEKPTATGMVEMPGDGATVSENVAVPPGDTSTKVVVGWTANGVPMMYCAEATVLGPFPEATAMASMVFVVASVIGLLYTSEFTPGVLPSVV